MVPVTEKDERLVRLPPWCEHGNLSSLHPTSKLRGEWSKIYWPIALVVAICLFFIPDYSGMGTEATAWGLLGAAVILLVPESLCFFTGNAQDTLSDWVWDTWHVTGTQPVSKWDAAHYFMTAAWLFIAINVTVFSWERAWQFGLFSLLILVGWLTFHFSGRWWT